MRNVLAIAGKELRSYFASPIAYVVIGFFALQLSVGWEPHPPHKTGHASPPPVVAVNAPDAPPKSPK